MQRPYTVVLDMDDTVVRDKDGRRESVPWLPVLKDVLCDGGWDHNMRLVLVTARGRGAEAETQAEFYEATNWQVPIERVICREPGALDPDNHRDAALFKELGRQVAASPEAPLAATVGDMWWDVSPADYHEEREALGDYDDTKTYVCMGPDLCVGVKLGDR